MNAKRILSLVLGIVFIGIAIYIAIYLTDVSKNLIEKLGFGWVMATIVARTLVCLSFGRGLQLIVQSFAPHIKGIIVFLIGFVLGFGFSFLSPIYQSDYGDFSTVDNIISVDHQGLTELTNGNYQIKNQPYILVFFTSTCSHCKAASKNIGYLSQLGKMPPIIAVFPGNEENTRTFLNENNGQTFEYYRISDEQFFIENSGAAFPSIFLINEKGETMKHWFGELLNYSALDYLESVKQ